MATKKDISVKAEEKEVKQAGAAKKAASQEKKPAATAAKPKSTAAKKPAAKPATAAKKPAAKHKAKVSTEVGMPAERALMANRTKIMYVASECQPYAATGGLGDVIGSLPKSLAKKNLDITVVLPLYEGVGGVYRDKMKYVTNTSIMLSWRNQYMGIFKLEENGVTYYFIDNEYYFKRPALYGFYDDGERFAYFSKAAIELMFVLNYFPDIIHAHDWQTSLVPIYLKTLYREDERLKKIKTVFTIHNIEYQGKFNREIIGDVFGIDTSYSPLLEYNGIVNTMKGAIVCAESVTTVSPTYAMEILSEQFSHGLHYILTRNSEKLTGILNGIDYDFYNPASDKCVFMQYDIERMQDKAENKLQLQAMLGLKVSREIPMLSVISRLVSHKGIDLINESLENILAEQDIQVVILGKGDSGYEQHFKHLESKYPDKLRTIIAYNQDLSRKIYSASDLFLMPSRSEPCGLSQMIASRYGAVPIVRETGGLYDSIKDFGIGEDGNGYTFSSYNSADMTYVVKKAIREYLGEDWQRKVKRVMTKDFSWAKSADKYAELYSKLIKR